MIIEDEENVDGIDFNYESKFLNQAQDPVRGWFWLDDIGWFSQIKI